MKVLVTDYRDGDLSLERDMLAAAGHELAVAQCTSSEEVIAAASGVSALMVRYAPIRRAVFEALPDLGLVVRHGVGVDVIDLEAARAHGVWIANVPDYGPGEVAAHAFAMAMSLARHLPGYDRGVRAGKWGYLSTGPIRRLSTLTFGILGLGRIGSITARAARQWFGEVIACDPYLKSWPDGVKQVDRDTLFRRSDVLSLHAPLTDETRHIANAHSVGLMPAGSILVNSARGGLVETGAVVAALEAGRLAAAGLDVHETEPLPPDHPLCRSERVILSPHTAFYSEQSVIDLRSKVVQNVIDWARNGRPRNVVVEGRAA